MYLGYAGYWWAYVSDPLPNLLLGSMHMVGGYTFVTREPHWAIILGGVYSDLVGRSCIGAGLVYQSRPLI